jgi:hypothetical protein
MEINPTPIYLSLGVITVIALILLVRMVRIRRGSPPIPVQLESGLERAGIQSPKILLHWARYSRMSPLARAYNELNRALSRLGRPPVLSDTPSERANDLVQLLPVSEGPVRAVIIPYQNAIYGEQPEETEAAQQAGKEIRKISYFAKLQRILSRFQDPKRSRKSTDQPELHSQ